MTSKKVDFASLFPLLPGKEDNHGEHRGTPEISSKMGVEWNERVASADND